MKKNRRKILSGSRKIFFAILAMFLSLSASAQQITASGQVLDAQKEPLIGVSVQEKGTSNPTCYLRINNYYTLLV